MARFKEGVVVIGWVGEGCLPKVREGMKTNERWGRGT